VSRSGLTGLALAFALGCGASGEVADVSAPPPAVVIGATEAVEEALVEPILGTGTIAAQKTTNISPRVDGIIEEIYVKVGDRVEAGAPLFRTREIDYRIRLDQQRAAVRLASAEAEKARRDLERARGLSTRNVLSDEALDQAGTRDRIASAKLESARAARARARQDLEDVRVTAPYDGVITRRYVDEGAFIRSMMSTNSPVVQIMKIDVVLAIVHVPEIHLPRIRVGTPARVRIDGLACEYESEVYILNDRVEHTSHSIELRLPIVNDDLAIKPGLFAKAELLPAPRSALLVDRRAVLGSGENRWVFMAKGDRAVRRPVEVRDLDATRVEVLSGLVAGERVLVGPNLARLDDGTPVLLQASDVAL
jgi:RND family efflux transporter MFP subunit